ncbi:MAG: hypothetical protein M1831_006423 [Alyxoria varia]|nr:MAG: hypothetical protein M1831_006423 [Alyxoria varia]
MSLKKPALLLSSSSLFNVIPSQSYPVHAASFRPCSSVEERPQPSRYKKRRSYATVAHEDFSREGQLTWPTFDDPRKVPSPYEIFNQREDEKYSKRRFYELVKLYHPDRLKQNDNLSRPASSHKCSHKDKLERYRLVVAANNILSDPKRKHAYDRYGIGWTHVREIEKHETTPTHIYRYSTHHRWRSDGDKQYKWHVDDDPMFNATWEDWERWYRRIRQRREQRYYHTTSSSNPWSSTFFTQGSPQEQVYLNNYHFVALVALIAVMGGVGQATRAQEGAASRKERIDKKNTENSEYLNTARENGRAAAAQHSGKKDRIRKWVREREGYTDGEPDGRAARGDDGGICASNDIKERDQPPFWKRPPERPPSR